MVILAVNLQLIVTDHLLDFNVSIGGIRIEAVALGTLLSSGRFPIFGPKRLELAEAMLTDLVAVLAGVELLVGGDDEAEGALDHVLDHACLHHTSHVVPN